MAADFDAQVLDVLLKTFNETELHDLCFRLGVDWETLPHRTKDELARELILYSRRHGKLNELIDIVRVLKPHYPWPDPPFEAGFKPVPTIPIQRPPAATHFTGRAPELAELLAALQPGRIVTLYGPGGIGKTSLAAEALRELAPGDDPPAQFPGGVFFHTFYGRPAVADAAGEIARACGLDPNPDPLAAMRAALRGRVALLILDGAEEADDLDALLELRERCAALVTSRRRVDVKEVGIEVERLPIEEALALLWALVHPHRKLPEGEGAWPGADEAAAREICELMGNLPLALRLAGSYMFQSGDSAAEFLAGLRQSLLAALDFGDRRRESVPLLLEKSVAQVSDAARAVLGVAGCLSIAPFDAAPVAAALDVDEAAARRALGELHNYELLRRLAGRYETAHALIHAYSRERLSVAPEVLRRLGQYYVALAEGESAKGLPGYRRLDPERGHILAVLARLAAAEGWEMANDLAWAVHDWLDIQGYSPGRIAALEVGLAAARALTDLYSQEAHSGHLGVAYANLGQIEWSIEFFEVALAISKEIGDRRGEGIERGNLGNAYRILGQVERAIEYCEAALAVAREIGDRRGEGNHLGNLGLAYVDLGQVERAIEYYEAALAVTREIGDRRGEGTKLGNLGNAYADLGQVERAIEYYEAALAIAREIGDRRGEGNHLGNLGIAYSDLGQVEWAIDQYEAALAIDREIGDRRGEGADLGNLGNAYRSLGQVTRAIEFYEAALAIDREIGNRRGEGADLGNLGNAYRNLGQVAQAIEQYEAALAIAREIGDRRGEGNHLGNLGLAYADLGQVERAIELYEAALAVAREIGDRRGEGNHLYNRALTLEQIERRDEAIESMAAALAAYESIDAPNDAADAREELARLQGAAA